MVQLTHWFQSALHLIAAMTLSLVRQSDVKIPWMHKLTYTITMWLIARWWHDNAPNDNRTRVDDCGQSETMCYYEHVCDKHRMLFRKRFCIVNRCPEHGDTGDSCQSLAKLS